MCITEVWTYRECGCRYHQQVPCHPSFSPSSTIPGRLRADHHHHSTASSSSDRSLTSTSASAIDGDHPFPVLSRQCSIRHVVHKNFLEPICDDCLLEELGLQPELGSILGGRDLEEGLHGEEWLLESSVEIRVEEADELNELAISKEHEDEEAADADDEGEFRGRSARRCGMDISRGGLRISSELSVDEQEGLALFREELRSVDSEGRQWARAVIKAPKEPRRLTPYSTQQHHESGSGARKDEMPALSVAACNDGSMSSSQHDPWTTPLNQEIEAEARSLTDAPLSQQRPSREDINMSIDLLGDETVAEQDSCRDGQHPSWSDHLKADLQDRRGRDKDGTPEGFEQDGLQQPPRSPCSIPSSPPTATSFHFSSWSITGVPPLDIASSEFDTDDPATPLHVTQTPNSAAHTTSTDSSPSNSTFCTASSGPSSARQTSASAVTSSTRPTTATSITTTTSQLSLHPLSTALTISTPHRPSLTSRVSSLRSPPASSPLLHSTPPLHQSPTSVFVCVHERWAFRGCGCEGPSWVRSCVCDAGSDLEPESRSEELGMDGCKAAEPMVRTRWFFNPTCEACVVGT